MEGERGGLWTKYSKRVYFLAKCCPVNKYMMLCCFTSDSKGEPLSVASVNLKSNSCAASWHGPWLTSESTTHCELRLSINTSALSFYAFSFLSHNLQRGLVRDQKPLLSGGRAKAPLPRPRPPLSFWQRLEMAQALMHQAETGQASRTSKCREAKKTPSSLDN